MATQSVKTTAPVAMNLNTQFGLTDGTSYLAMCIDDDLIINEHDDGDPVSDFGIRVSKKTPLIIKPESGKTLWGRVATNGTVVVTEAP